MSLTLIQEVRLLVGDNDPSLPILSDQEYQYFLDKNQSNVRRASLQAAQTILYKLSMKTRQTVDIFDLYGQQAAQNYIQALKLYLKSPELNPVFNGAQGYVGGISREDMRANDSNADNNVIETPLNPVHKSPKTLFDV
jgi:hypothetical protein